jgi:hypothetical protein
METTKDKIIDLLKEELEKEELLKDVEHRTNSLKRKFEGFEKRRLKLVVDMELAEEEEFQLRRDIHEIVTKRTEMIREVKYVKQELSPQDNQTAVPEWAEEGGDAEVVAATTTVADTAAATSTAAAADTSVISDVTMEFGEEEGEEEDDDDDTDDTMSEAFMRLFREAFTVTFDEDDLLETVELTRWMRQMKLWIPVKHAHELLKKHFVGLVWKTFFDLPTPSPKKFRRCIVGLKFIH